MADIKISAETSAGALDGTEIVPVVRGTGSPPTYANRRTTAQAIANLAALALDGLSDVNAPAPSNGNVLTYQSGSPAGWIASAPAAGGGSGLYAPVLSTIPTSANTGLSTWGNQGSASVADTAVGVTITSPSAGATDSWNIRHKTAPATPYTITGLVALTSMGATILRGVGMGWYDGTKAQVMRLVFNGNAAPTLYVSNETTLTAFSANVVGPFSMVMNPCWMRLADNGTNITFSTSHDGVNFSLVYTVAKASGFLGSGGYSSIFFGVEANGETTYGTLMSYAQA